MFNSTTQFSTIDSDFSLTTKIFVCIEYIFLIVFGVPLYFGIIQYEMNGGDPQKRSLSNKLYSLLCFELMLQMLTQMTSILLRVVFGPLGHVFASIYMYLQAIIVFMPAFTVIQILLYKNLQIYKYRLSAGMHDEFWFIFAVAFDVTMAIVSVTFQSANFSGGTPMYELLQGDNFQRKTETKRYENL